ncbi:MAG: hypothetical protein ACREQJ_12550 [Candidatus Binatia bacterium]
MSTARAILLAATLALFAGCPSAKMATTFPAPVTKLVSAETFPEEAAGFERGEVFAYAADMKQLSAEYSLLADDLQIAATLDFLPHEAGKTDLGERLKLEKVDVGKFYVGARFLNEEDVVLEKKGVSYPARRLAYEFEGMFRGQRQQLRGELYLWSHQDRWLKLRAMAPSWQRKKMTAKNLELLQAIDWSS